MTDKEKRREINAKAYAKVKERLTLVDKLERENEILRHENDILRLILDRLGQEV